VIKTLTDVKNEKNEEKKNELATDNKNELKEKRKSLEEQNQFYNVHTENNQNLTEDNTVATKNSNNPVYTQTEEAFLNKPVETENCVKPHVLNTEPNEIKQNYVKVSPIIKQKQKEDIRSNANEQSNRFYDLDKGEQHKYNFATHFINTSTTYDKNADLKNATFDEKLNNGKDGGKPKEKKLQAPLNMKKNTRKLYLEINIECITKLFTR
jgi:hypothetical protein